MVATDVYNNQKDINVWYKGSANRYYDRKNKDRRLSGAKSVSSVKSSNCRSNASLCSSKRSSVKERMRQMEEVKLRMQILEDKQRIEWEIEEEEYQFGIRKLWLEREVAKNK